MYAKVIGKVFVVGIALISIASMFSCAGREFAPREPYMYWYYPKELTDAAREVRKLREACPKHYAEEKARLDKAFEEYSACNNPDIKIDHCPPLTCKLEADKTEIKRGGSVILTLTPSGEFTSFELDGTLDKTEKTVRPTTTTTYNAKVVGYIGSTRCKPVTVIVLSEPPTCKLEADKTTIKVGESVTLTLTPSGEVTSAMIGKESVATNGGTITINPEKATKFIATVEGPGGANTCTAAVSLSLDLMVHFPFDRPKELNNEKFPHDEPETWFDNPDAINAKDSLDPCKNNLNQPLEDNLTLLRSAVDFVKDNPGTDIQVTGYADCLGPDKDPDQYNNKLSDRRAHAVAAYLGKKLGLDNISWKGLGSTQPYRKCEQYKQGKCDRDACDCRAKNRRVVIRVIPR